MTTENEQLVQQTMAQLIGDGGVGAVEHLLSEDFRHYRPEGLIRNKSEWLADISQSLLSLEGMQVEILHLFSDGDYVVIHTRRRLPDGKPGIVVVDILRITDGQFVEVWELVEPIASAQAHLTWWEL
ncbi:nuclear transport factor 2 family protein [Kribbella sp. NPDC056345]|uniref:nuclear transport factor 2 family protein n=1 Tax=Kribbella sp. NPDC056345 TaxID=3345789 RepID=UPI0035DA9D35